MSAGRKIFLVIASFIVGMSAVFVLLTYIVIRDSMDVMLHTSRKEELSEISESLTRYYTENGRSFEGAEAEVSLQEPGRNTDHEESILLVSPDQALLLHQGTAPPKLIRNLGVMRELTADGKLIGQLYYYDTDIANLTKLRIGTPTSIAILLGGGALLFVLLSLGAAYWISGRLTAPLRALIPFIDRLGKGEYGIQAPVVSKDEYGKVVLAFNGMSAKLKQAEIVRRNLAADVAHELRTPLTIVRGKLDLLQQSGQPIEPTDLLPVQDELIRLTRLVGDLHQLSLAEAGKLQLDVKSCDMTKLLQRLIDRISPETEDKALIVRFTSTTAHTTVPVDPNRITQVFLNLLINAVRYTPEGGDISVSLHEDADSKRLRIDIRDSGPGIDEQHLPHLFNRFYRTDQARARHQGGMGLGLAIAKELVVSHGGAIEVESRIGHGTTFKVSLPYLHPVRRPD
ncbi:two-component sensor histidine kinase [Paenibacillus ihbetae]|uniref:histidine kinase n=1 Tax=Paenibacillus ihbetae TaxID=1870820 RepID=A0A1B2E4C8_9BACL|nr:ATP-binding protein [Paenibacillus ihbetae]ANY74821.1 two-component sensor histidine kinase [Paenibacillus ihbetae]